MKSTKGEAKIEETQSDAVTIKAEYKLEQGSDGEEGFSEVYTNGHGLNIQIKEEPHSQEISEEHSEGTEDCLDTKPDTITDAYISQGHIKEEFDSYHSPHYEFTEAAVKEEPESWVKEERESEEEVEDASSAREGFEEGEEEACRGRDRP